ncbi:MAG: DEAD/DEAH box helicase [Deltaproteobacteria bacterium]|nr:DEAD/DEAH box helicase [Deltaproteobacteria bacterium]
MKPPVVQLSVEGPRLDSPAYSGARRWLKEWGALSAFSKEIWSADVHLELPVALWTDAGKLPIEDAADEEQWVSQHEAFALLLGLDGQELRLESTGHIGAHEMCLHLKVDGTTPGNPRRVLPISWTALQTVEAFNSRSSKPQEAQLEVLGRLRAILDRAGTLLQGTRASVAFSLDDHLAQFKIRSLSRVAPVLEVDTRGRLFNVELEISTDDQSGVRLDLDDLHPDSPIISRPGREYLLLSPDVETVARAACRQRNILRRKAEALLENPTSWIPPGLDDFDKALDLSRYSDRVIGFTPFRIGRNAEVRSLGVDWYRTDRDPSVPFLRLEVTASDGRRHCLDLQTPASAQALLTQLTSRRTTNDPTPINVDGRAVHPSPELERCVREHLQTYQARVVSSAENEGAEPETPASTASGRALVAILRDPAEGSQPSAPQVLEIDEGLVPWATLERLLCPSLHLKPHQRAGVAWLWHHALSAQRAGDHPPGVLLADDMGLGKTLQIACFLALRRASTERVSLQLPSLVVCPTILLDNWLEELRRFFIESAFGRVLALHGERKRALRAPSGHLDPRRISAFDLILTNYQTLAGNQPSLLALDYDVVILDEAQNIKNPDTGCAIAARGLKKRFGICVTGTPVENRLSDLWSLFDFLRPGDPFSTFPKFKRDYDETAGSGVERIREALSYPAPTSRLLRRDKTALDLPPKTIVERRIPMTEAQMSRERIVTHVTRNKVLGILHDLQKLYQHPVLLSRAVAGTDSPTRTWKEVEEESPKIRLCLSILEEIEAKREKALVFTLWLQMQDLLAEIISRHFRLASVDIVNGDPERRRRALATIRRFSDGTGFDVLILSPLAAGTGLNIVAANHVIHYGRWWNPAKEDQATDRAHRIGQTRPVTVYYPLLHHPGDPEGGFDVKLHQLVEHKRSVARDFLRPQNDDLTLAELQLALGAGT